MPIEDQQWGYIRDDRNSRLRNDVDPKTMEAFNNGTELSPEWKTYRQELRDMDFSDPDNITWYLVNAVKELSAKNDALVARITALESH